MDGRARECLERATYCRQPAEGERDPEMRAYLLRLAADWTSAAKRNFHENRRMDEFREREHLAQADWHIAEAKAHIARQKDTIAELKRDGHETKVAMLMLNALKHTLCAFEQHREVILVRLRNG
jgi:hypothetical protein